MKNMSEIFFQEVYPGKSLLYRNQDNEGDGEKEVTNYKTKPWLVNDD